LERKWGVHSAIGGTGALVDGMVSLIEGQGGTIRYREEVEQILVEDGKATGVRLKSGESIPARVVISNADAAWTYRYLLLRSIGAIGPTSASTGHNFRTGCSSGTSVRSADIRTWPTIRSCSARATRAPQGYLQAQAFGR
jgi:glycine/D-amino acid oxidase-like deaminating enzyme